MAKDVLGVDTYDPSGNEIPMADTGDVYQIYGASHQNGDAYVLHVGDIDVVSLGVVGRRCCRGSASPVTDLWQFRRVRRFGRSHVLFVFEFFSRMDLEDVQRAG